MCCLTPLKKVVVNVEDPASPPFESRDEQHFSRFITNFRWLCNDWMLRLERNAIPRKIYTFIFLSTYNTYWSDISGRIFFCVDPFTSVLAFLVGNGAPIGLRRLFWCLFFQPPEFDENGSLEAGHPFLVLSNAIGNVPAQTLLDNGAFVSVLEFNLKNYLGVIPWARPQIRYPLTRQVYTTLTIADADGMPVDWDKVVSSPENHMV